VAADAIFSAPQSSVAFDQIVYWNWPVYEKQKASLEWVEGFHFDQIELGDCYRGDLDDTTALPRFADLGRDARIASLKSMEAAFRTCRYIIA
jgi:hypothetical protein